MRTDTEILTKISDLEISKKDMFGFIRSDLIAYLSFEEAKPFLKDDVTSEQWTPEKRDHDAVRAKMEDYMTFAWEKANNARGLSAGRSINHMQAWLWMLGEDEVAEAIEDYQHYGKPQLRAICKHYGWNWPLLDNDIWGNSESDPFSRPADKIDDVVLPWKGVDVEAAHEIEVTTAEAAEAEIRTKAKHPEPRSPYWALQPERLYNAAIDVAIEQFDLEPQCRHDRHDIACKLEKIWNALELPRFIKQHCPEDKPTVPPGPPRPTGPIPRMVS